MIAVPEQRVPRSAVDDRGHDVLDLIRQRDGRYPTFPLTDYDGLARPHSLTLDLGDLSDAKSIMLFLDGWIYRLPLAAWRGARICGGSGKWPVTATTNWTVVWQYRIVFLQGLAVTVQLSLAWAAAAMLLADPHVVTDVGFGGGCEDRLGET